MSRDEQKYMKCAECDNYTNIAFMNWYQVKLNGKPIQAYKRVCWNCNGKLKQAENYDEMKA